jgi:N-methylhydantoinase B
VNPPWGLDGGRHAKGNRIAIKRKDGNETVFPGGKVDTRLAKGERYIMSSGGGGGFGEPRERPLEALRRDVRQGYVSLESAWQDYGVRFDPETLEPLSASDSSPGTP